MSRARLGPESWSFAAATVAMSLTVPNSRPLGMPCPPKKGDFPDAVGTPQCKKRLRAGASAERTFANFLSCHVDFLFTIIAELSSPALVLSSFRPIGPSPAPCWPSWFTLQANGISIKFYFYESSSRLLLGPCSNQWNIIELITSSRRTRVSLAPACVGAT